MKRSLDSGKKTKHSVNRRPMEEEEPEVHIRDQAIVRKVTQAIQKQATMMSELAFDVYNGKEVPPLDDFQKVLMKGDIRRMHNRYLKSDAFRTGLRRNQDGPKIKKPKKKRQRLEGPPAIDKFDFRTTKSNYEYIAINDVRNAFYDTNWDDRVPSRNMNNSFVITDVDYVARVVWLYNRDLWYSTWIACSFKPAAILMENWWIVLRMAFWQPIHVAHFSDALFSLERPYTYHWYFESEPYVYVKPSVFDVVNCELLSSGRTLDHNVTLKESVFPYRNLAESMLLTRHTPQNKLQQLALENKLCLQGPHRIQLAYNCSVRGDVNATLWKRLQEIRTDLNGGYVSSDITEDEDELVYGNLLAGLTEAESSDDVTESSDETELSEEEKVARFIKIGYANRDDD
jgi:hypothetical protein